MKWFDETGRYASYEYVWAAYSDDILQIHLWKFKDKIMYQYRTMGAGMGIFTDTRHIDVDMTAEEVKAYVLAMYRMGG